MKMIFFFKFLKIPYSILHEVDKISHELYVMIHDNGSDFDAMLSFFFFRKRWCARKTFVLGATDHFNLIFAFFDKFYI